MEFDLNNLPECIKVIPNRNNEEFNLRLSEEELILAKNNASFFLDSLRGYKVNGDDVAVAIWLTDNDIDFRNGDYAFSEYTVKSLLKFLDKDFKLIELYVM